MSNQNLSSITDKPIVHVSSHYAKQLITNSITICLCYDGISDFTRNAEKSRVGERVNASKRVLEIIDQGVNHELSLKVSNFRELFARGHDTAATKSEM